MHPPEGPAWLVALESSGFAAAMRHWLWLYPIVEIMHILGFVLLIGAAVMFDLRLLGFSPRIPVSDLARHLLPWSRAGLLLVVPSGLAHVRGARHRVDREPGVLGEALPDRAGRAQRLGLPSLDVPVGRGLGPPGAGSPRCARVSAVASLLLWTGVVSCGRLLAYL